MLRGLELLIRIHQSIHQLCDEDAGVALDWTLPPSSREKTSHYLPCDFEDSGVLKRSSFSWKMQYMKIPGDPYRSPKDSQGSYFLHVSVSDCIWKPLFSTNSSYFHPTWAICGAKVLGPFVALPHLFWVVFFYS